MKKLKDFYILWSTQSLSQLGSAITAFALTLWMYEKTGSALNTAALSICTYAPYVIMSIFAGALTDKFDKKKTMLTCDVLAAFTTVGILVLYKTNTLSMWYLYLINVLSGLMNTVQQPASEVAYTLVVDSQYYQKMSGLLQLSRSLISVGNPLIASVLYSFTGLEGVIAIDLLTFSIAFITLLMFIKLPDIQDKENKNDNVIKLAKEGISFLKQTPLILTIILFMAGVNLTASAFDAVLPALVIAKEGNNVYGIVCACSGGAMVVGSFLPMILPKPKDRVRVIYLSMLFALGIENFLLAFSRLPFLWCIAQVIGWIFVPLMAANMSVIMRNVIPVELQGRVFACRNTLQFFTIPIGLFLGGFFVDKICEPFMKRHKTSIIFTTLFGSGKGSGAALMMGILGITGILICLISGQFMKRYKYVE